MVQLIKTDAPLSEQGIEIISPQQMEIFLKDYNLLKRDNKKRREYYEIARRKNRPRDESLRYAEQQELDLFRAYWEKLAIYCGKIGELNLISIETFKPIQPLGPRRSPLQINIIGDMSKLPSIQITLNDARHHLEKGLEQKVLGITSANSVEYNTTTGYAGNAFTR